VICSLLCLHTATIPGFLAAVSGPARRASERGLCYGRALRGYGSTRSAPCGLKPPWVVAISAISHPALACASWHPGQRVEQCPLRPWPVEPGQAGGVDSATSRLARLVVDQVNAVRCGFVPTVPEPPEPPATAGSWAQVDDSHVVGSGPCRHVVRLTTTSNFARVGMNEVPQSRRETSSDREARRGLRGPIFRRFLRRLTTIRGLPAVNHPRVKGVLAALWGSKGSTTAKLPAWAGRSLPSRRHARRARSKTTAQIGGPRRKHITGGRPGARPPR